MEKICIITNGQLFWELEVNGKSISFQGDDSAEYFRDHYNSLGYKLEFKEQKS
jgi:hypothetical protein